MHEPPREESRGRHVLPPGRQAMREKEPGHQAEREKLRSIRPP